MNIKGLLSLLFFFVSTGYGFAQSFEWIRHAPVDYSMNPSYPEFAVAFDGVNQRVVNSRIDSVALIYGTTVLGNTNVECRDTNGQVLWLVPLTGKANIERIATDLSGNYYVGGTFQETLYIGQNDSINFITGGFTSQNTFILKFDSQGVLIWKRNVTATWPDYEGIQAIAIDPAGNCWFALTDFFESKIIQMDGNGNDQVIHSIDNGKRIGNISFDPWGGMFVSGAAQNGNFIMNTDTFHVIHDYNMFIARFDPAGQPSWAYFGYDITFQRPMVAADDLGNAFFVCNRYDTTSFNGVFFNHPYLNSDFFAFKIDTAGSISWGLQQPALVIGPFGTFEQGSNLMVAADAAGKFYMGGVQRGAVDWGNGYTSSTPGFQDRRLAVACIDPAGSVQWVKIGGGTYSNFQHAIAVSDDGDCYFTGAFGDTAVFDTLTFNTTNFYNFVAGKISTAIPSGTNEEVMDQLQLYPNPATELINLPEKAIGSALEILDGVGRRVYYNENISDNRLHLPDLKQGTYMVVLNNNKMMSRSKLIIYR